MPTYAGVCQANITPPLGVWMCGYAFRPTGCLGVHDELYARALVVDDGDVRLAMVAMDLIGLDFDLVDQVRQQVSEEVGIPPDGLMLNATHTHGGPNVRAFNTMGSRDPAYTEVLVRKIAGTVKQAADQLRPAQFVYGRAPLQLGINRRQRRKSDGRMVIGHNYGGPVAPWVDVLGVLDARGEPFALLFSHACHGTTLGGDNLLITADFCGTAYQRIHAHTSGTMMPFFLQGCAGNINPNPRGTFEHARNHGFMLADAALEALSKATPLKQPILSCEVTSVELPLLPPPPPEACDRAIAEWEAKVEEEERTGDMGRILHARGMLDYARYERRMAERQEKPSTEFTLQLLNVHGARILGMPAEVFVQYALDFDQQAAGPVITLGYTNGVHGYLPTAADYDFGGYEVEAAHRYYGTLMFAPECEMLVRQASYRMLDIERGVLVPYRV
ncbi:MAG: neutral/alkaline non-lysosomal ceramidase N-terminal domain-containing protein [Chthonomonadales bacterium]